MKENSPGSRGTSYPCTCPRRNCGTNFPQSCKSWTMQCSPSIKQRLLEPLNIKLVLRLLRADPAPSRNSLAKELCRRLDLRDSKGDWQMATTGKALRELQDQGLWKLPEPLFSGGRGWNPTRLNCGVPAPRGVPEVLQELRGLCLVEVVDEEHLRIWNELMLREHP